MHPKMPFKQNALAYWPHRLVLAPLNRVQIDAFLHKLPQRAELSQEGHALLHSLEDVVDLGLCCESADAEADTAVSALVAASQRAQDVAGFEGC